MSRNNLIYQCWTGPLRSGVLASMANIKAYAETVGACYRFDHNPGIAGKVCDIPAYFEWLNPMLDDRFLEYDNVAVLDMDVFAVDGLNDSIFDCNVEEIGICTEEFQPTYRASLSHGICGKNDEKWAAVLKELWGIELPRTPQGLLKVYNAGVVVFSAKGLLKAKRTFLPFQTYISEMRRHKLERFYTLDQNYFHAMLIKGNIRYAEMDNAWNCYIHFLGDPNKPPRPVNDMRGLAPKLVHVQLRGADDFSESKLHRIVNFPQHDWELSRP